MLVIGEVLLFGGSGALLFEAGYHRLRAYGRIDWAIYPELRPVALMSVAVGLGLVVFASLRSTKPNNE